MRRTNPHCNLLILLVLAFSTSLWAAPRWHVPDAEYRLTVSENWKRKNTVLVRLPIEFQEWSNAQAFTSKGKEVGCRLIKVNGKATAVEVSITNGQMANRSIDELHVYPASVPSKMTGIIGQPVTCSYIGESFVARPADCAEMDHYLKIHPAVNYYRTLPSFPVKTYGIHLFYKLRQKTSERQVNFRSLKVRALLSSNLYTGTAEDVSFAIDNPDTGPWYLFLNDEPVFSWGNTTLEDGKYLRSQPVKTKPGLNRLDLFVFPDRSEMFPQLTIRRAGSEAFNAIAREDLFSSNECTGYQVDHRESNTLCEFQLSRKRGTFYRESGTSAFPFVITLPSSNSESAPEFSVKGNSLTFANNRADIVFHPGVSQVKVNLGEKSPLKELTIPVRTEHFKTRESIIKYRLSELPLFEPVEDEFLFSYRISVNHGKSKLPEGAEVSVRYLDDGGDVIASVKRPVPQSPFKYTIAIDRGIKGARTIESSVHIGGIQVSDAFKIHLIEPSAQLNLTSRGGDILHHKDGFATLIRQRGSIEVNPITVETIESVAFIDGFIAHSAHPLDPSPLIETPSGGVSITHIPISSHTGDQSKVASLLCTLSESLTADSDAVMIAPPVEVITKLDFRDQRELVIFMIKSVRAAGKRAILVSHPLEDTLERRRLRNYALMLKEVGRSLDTAVIDLYSASLREQNTGDYWVLPQTSSETIRTTSARAAGQQWMLYKIYNYLEPSK